MKFNEIGLGVSEKKLFKGVDGLRTMDDSDHNNSS